MLIIKTALLHLMQKFNCHTILNPGCRFYFLIVFLLLCFSCNTGRHNKKTVQAAMNHYDQLIMKLDADSIALLFTPDGDLGNIAHGRDSIKKFLSSFKNIEVVSQSSTTSSIKIIKDTAIQTGSYRQVDVIAGKDTVKVKGDFTATWLWLAKEGWHIKRMVTTPAN